MRKILLALDGSGHAQRALDLAVMLAKATGSELAILNVVTGHPITDAERNLAETEYWTEVSGALDALPPAAPEEGPQTIPSGPGALIRASHETGAVVRKVLGEQMVRQAALMAESKGVAKVGTSVQLADSVEAIWSERRDSNLAPPASPLLPRCAVTRAGSKKRPRRISPIS